MDSTTTGIDGKYLLMNLPLGRAYDVVMTDLFGVLEKYLPTTLGSPSQDNQSKAQPYSTFLALASTDFKADFGYARSPPWATGCGGMGTRTASRMSTSRASPAWRWICWTPRRR